MSLTQINHDTIEYPTTYPPQAEIVTAQIVASLPTLATTNYGNQVGYNYGSISNYFCHSSIAGHHHDFPNSTHGREQSEDEISKKLGKAQDFLTAGRYLDAQTICYEALYAKDVELDTAQRAAVQFSLGHAHFSAAEYIDALSNFEAVVNWVNDQEDAGVVGEMRNGPYWLGRCQFQLKNYIEASNVLHGHITVLEALPYCDTQNIIDTRLWLGTTLDCLGSHEAAKEQLQCAWSFQERASGAEHLDTLTSRHHLANLCFKQKLYTEAKEHFQWLLEVEERLAGPEKSQAVITRSMLAFSICELGDIEAAVPHLQRVLRSLELEETLSPDGKRNLSLIHYWIGRDHHRQRRNDKARVMFQRALMLLTQEQQLLDKILDCQLYMAISTIKVREYEAAEQILNSVLQTARERSCDDIVRIIHWLAYSLVSQRKFEEARAVLDEVDITSELIQASRWTGADAAACLYLRGEIHFEHRNWLEAKACFQTLVNVDPAEPNEFFKCYRFWLGKTLFKLEQFEEARGHFQSTFDLCQTGTTPSPGCIHCISWLAWTLAEVKENDLAEIHLRRMMQFYPQIPTRPTPIENMNLGRTKYYLGRLLIPKKVKDAAKLLGEAVVMLDRLSGEKDHIYHSCRYHLARALLEIQDYDQAQAILQDLSDLQHSSHAVHTICTFSASYRMAVLYMHQIKYKEAREILVKCLAVWSATIETEIDIRLVKRDLAFCDLKIGNLAACIEELTPIVDEIDWNDDSQKAYNYQLVNCLARALYFSYKYAEAVPHLEKDVAYWRSLPNCKTTAILEYEAYLADSYCELSRYGEAQAMLTRGALLNDAPPGTALGFCKAICKYWLGRLAMDDSKYTEAGNYLVEAVRLLGNRKSLYSVRTRHSCRLFLARVSLRRGRLSEAEVMFTDLLDHPVQDYFSSSMTDIQYLLGLTLKRRAKHAQAKDILMTALNNAHDAKLIAHMVPSCQYQLGMVLFRQCEYRDAETYFQQAVDYEGAFDQRFDARRMIGNCNFELEDFERARQVFQDLIADDSQKICCLAIYRFFLGRTLCRLHQYEEAETLLDYALKNLPSSSDLRLECHYLAGNVSFVLKQYSKAIGFLSVVKRARKSETLPMDTKTEILLGRCHLELHDHREAYEIFSTCLERTISTATREMEVENKTAQLYHAQCLKHLNKLGPAKRELENIVPFFTDKLAQHDSTLVLVKFELGDVAYLEEQYDDAADLLKEALLLHQQLSNVRGFDVWHYRLVFGHVLLKLNLQEEAVTMYRQIYRHRLIDDANSSDKTSNPIASRHILRDNMSNAESLAFAQERLVREEKHNETDIISVTKAKINVADAAFEMRYWQLVADTANQVISEIDKVSPMSIPSDINVGGLYAKYSFALTMLQQPQESREQGLRAVNIGCREYPIQSTEEPRYASAYAACLGSDPAELQAVVQQSCTRNKTIEESCALDARRIVHPPRHDFSEVIAYGEIDNQPQVPHRLALPSSVTQISSKNNDLGANLAVATPSSPHSPVRPKSPRPPVPHKSPRLSDYLTTRMRTQSVR